MHRLVLSIDQLRAEEIHDGRGEHMHPEKAEIMACPQSGDDELLFGFGGSGFFDQVLDFIEGFRAGDEFPADRPIKGELAFMGRLNGRDGAILGAGHLH